MHGLHGFTINLLSGAFTEIQEAAAKEVEEVFGTLKTLK